MPSARNKAYVLAIRPNAALIPGPRAGWFCVVAQNSRIGLSAETPNAAWRNAAEYLRNKYAGDQP